MNKNVTIDELVRTTNRIQTVNSLELQNIICNLRERSNRSLTTKNRGTLHKERKYLTIPSFLGIIFFNKIESSVTIVLEYPPALNVSGIFNHRSSPVSKQVETYKNSDVIVEEEERVLKLLLGSKPGSNRRQLTYSLNKFMYFNGHLEKGKIGIRFYQSKYNPSREVLVLINSENIDLIKDINTGIMSLKDAHFDSTNNAHRRSRIDITKTPLQGSPSVSNRASPDMKKPKELLKLTPNKRVPSGCFGFASSRPAKTPPDRKNQMSFLQCRNNKLSMLKSPQVVFENDCSTTRIPHHQDDVDEPLSFSRPTATSAHTKLGTKGSISSLMFDLSEEQKEVVQTILHATESVFFTGSGGCGKSYLLQKLIQLLPAETTAVTASTGIAACHIGGVTLHNFLGIGRVSTSTGSVDPNVAGASQQAINRVLKNSDRCSYLRKIKVLIIDEISLVDKQLFELMNDVLCAVRTPSVGSNKDSTNSNKSPLFGGIQLVLSGDFLQLPPVGESNTVKFCFQSKVWRKGVSRTFYLKKPFRQQSDFALMLDQVRFGLCPDKLAVELLRRTVSNTSTSNTVKLVSLNKEVHEINDRELAKLSTSIEGANTQSNNIINRNTYMSTDTQFDSGVSIDSLCVAKSALTIAVGARVILLTTVSFSEKLVNGSVGTVVRLSKSPPIVYVQFANNSSSPVGISPHDFVFSQSGKEVARRRQIPLALAWAISIHKSQGMTLDKCDICLDRIFENGQAYVALSRCKSLEGISIISSCGGKGRPVTVESIKSAIRANPVCVDFYTKLMNNGNLEAGKENQVNNE